MPKKSSKPSGDTEAIAPEKAAKKSKAALKATPKITKPTTVTKPAKGKKPAAKASKKITKKVIKKVVQPKITDEMFEKWFFKRTNKQFVQLTKDWNETNLKVTLKKQENYDGWLNYFKTLSPNVIRLLATTGLDILPTEGYAALAFWHDIISNPSRIKNIHRAGLTNGGKSEKTIVDHAKENNRMGVLEAIRDELASKLQQGAGARDAGQLSAQMMEVMTQIDVYKRRQEPKAETPLGALMSDMPNIKKRPSENGKGARHTSFASRVTIEDLEAADGK